MFKKNKLNIFTRNHKIYFLLFLFFFTCSTFSQNVSEYSFAIAKLTEKQSIEQILGDNISKENFGISIEIFEESETIKLKLDKGELHLDTFFTLFYNHIKNNSNQVFPLFMEGNVDEKIFNKLLKSSNLTQFSFRQPTGERWPELKKLINLKKTLILFTDFKSPYTNLISKHTLEFKSYVDLKKDKQIIGNEFLIVKHFTEKNLLKSKAPENWDKINTNSYSIRYLLSAWKTCGKQPNFIFYSLLKHKQTFYYLANLLNETTKIKGVIIANQKIVEAINWGHKKKSLTGGYFNFPYTQDNQFVLKPTKGGYNFIPSSIAITHDKANFKKLSFQAEKLKISEGLKATYLFNNSLNNEGFTESLSENNPNFVNDKEKGIVLKLENQNSIKLNKVSNYGIVNSSFTIAIDFKYLKNKTHKNYCILGSDEKGFRKGLHVNIKGGVPVFGFYTNDTKSDSIIAPNQWNHFIARYNINTRTQSIYINGRLVGESINKPSFIGSTNLVLGQGIKQNNYFTGYLDNLRIWNRALSHQEIQFLPNKDIQISKKTDSKTKAYIFLGIIVTVFLILAIYFVLRLKKPSQKKNGDQYDVINYKHKNAIYLFGKFSVLNNEGIDVSNEITPKIKELFLLVLLRTLKNKKGITTSELTEILWEGFTSSKAANNRGVSFSQLKKVLHNIEGVEVVYENKFWRIILSDDIYIDYNEVLDFIKFKGTDYSHLFNIVKKGEFLLSVKKDWLLQEKSNLNFDIIDSLLIHLEEEYKLKQYQKTLQVIDYIQLIDDLNIQCLYYQLHCLIKLKSIHKANFVFNNYTTKYKSIYGISFKYSFNELLKENPNALW